MNTRIKSTEFDFHLPIERTAQRLSIVAREWLIVTFRDQASSGMEHPQAQQIEFGAAICTALD